MRRMLILVVLMDLSSFAQRKPDAVIQGFRGSVHTVRVESQQGTEELQPESEENFDSNGWVKEFKEYSPEGKLKSISIFKRDGPQMIEVEFARYLPEEQAERTVTTFEEHGFPIQQVKYAPDGSVRERVINDYQETEIREQHYDGSGKLLSTRTISTLHDPNSPDRHIEQRLDGKPELTADLHSIPGRVEVQKKTYKDGKVSEQTVSDIRLPSTSTATLRSDGGLFAASTRNGEFDEIINSDGSRLKSKFNDAGQKIEEDRFDPVGKLTERAVFTYEIDDHGNWTRRETRAFNGDKLIGTATKTRTISYY